MRSPTTRALWIACALALAPVAHAGAQQGRAPVPYMGVLAGAHVGLDWLYEGFLIGGQGIFQVDPWGRVALIPNAQFEFRQGIRDWQANADAAVMPVPGLYVGGGAAWRKSIYDEDIGFETRRGFSLFAGFREPPSPGRPNIQAELRWSFISDIRPRTITVGANYPLFLFR